MPEHTSELAVIVSRLDGLERQNRKLKQLLLGILVIATVLILMGRWPTQARFWLEWGSSIFGHNRPAARSRLFAVHCDSISTRPSHPVA